jgi:hypothetical protein
MFVYIDLSFGLFDRGTSTHVRIVAVRAILGALVRRNLHESNLAIGASGTLIASGFLKSNGSEENSRNASLSPHVLKLGQKTRAGAEWTSSVVQRISKIHVNHIVLIIYSVDGGHRAIKYTHKSHGRWRPSSRCNTTVEPHYSDHPSVNLWQHSGMKIPHSLNRSGHRSKLGRLQRS